MRVVLWSQHLLGSGHLHRSARIAAALADAGAEVVLVNGGLAPPGGAPTAYARLDLPALAARSLSFDGLVDAEGAPVSDAHWQARAQALHGVAEGPVDALVVEHFPFGRRAFARELVPLLADLHGRTPRPACLVSVRDVLVSSAKPGRAETAVELVRRWFDRVLVHGDPRLVPFERTFPLASQLADRLVYTGYVAPKLPAPAAGGAGVLVSAGGGAVGERLLAAALQAAEIVAERWTVIAGHNLPAERLQALRATCPPGVTLLRHVDDLPRLLAGCAVSVSQAGYNTVLEALALRRPMVLVPFATASETEQTVRAAAVADLGAAIVLDEERLDGRALASAVRTAAGRPFPDLVLDLNGAATAARLILDLARGRR